MERLSPDWVPRTRLGRKVLEGEIKTMSEALNSGLPLRETEIVDILLPDLEDEVLDVNMVQRMTDSGRRVNFVVTVVVGNGDGFVGLGRCKGREVGPTIRKSIEMAKLNMIEIKRGCGSWECGCGTAHSLPFQVEGKGGSVVVTFKPSPQGIALAVAEVPRHILRLAGIRDAWGFSKGHTKTTVNYAIAAFDALKKTGSTKVTRRQLEELHIVTGPTEELKIEPEPEPIEESVEDTEEEEAPTEEEVEPPEVPEKEPEEEPSEDEKEKAVKKK
ncbi:MAG: 30S ribosomal protein S5 [Methanobacteriota archaeon]|nr:MAG: 30S ribosomal protein S5 [Euryarchaeota archaeon]